MRRRLIPPGSCNGPTIHAVSRTRPRNRNIRARSRVGKRKWYVASGLQQAKQGGDDVPPLQGHPGLSDASEGTGVPESRGEVGVQDPEHHDGARDTRWRDDRMTGRRSHGRLSALNGVVHQGSDQLVAYLAQQAQAVPARRRPHPAGPAAPRTASPLRLVRRGTA